MAATYDDILSDGPPQHLRQDPNFGRNQMAWSNIIKKQPPPKPQDSNLMLANQVFVENRFSADSKSSKGISVAIVDANAIIEGGERLSHSADRFVSVPEVIAEIRDPVSRHRLNFAPFTIDTMEPSPESLNKVIKFARATGDLQTLSDVDLKLIALTYTLEAQIHGTGHIRDCPPPVQTVNVKRLPEKDMPGWGSNVPNLEEWEALEEVESGSNFNSRILPLKDLNMNTFPSGCHSESGSMEINDEVHSEEVDVESSSRKPRKYLPKKKEINIEGKKMVADGIDASQGQFDDDAGDWMPSVSRSTHRRYLRRKARREHNEALFEKDAQQDVEKTIDGNVVESSREPVQLLHQSSEEEADTGNGISVENEIPEGKDGDENISSILKQMRLEEDSLEVLQEGKELGISSTGFESNMKVVDTASDNNENMVVEGDEINRVLEGLDHSDITSQTNESVDASFVDDDSSEQSWMLRSLSESSIACVTGDYAMQNVLLQMGLRLLAPGGMQIRQLHRWILKCHACYMVTAEIGRIFCPKCGNGGTLRKVAVTVGENGVVLADRRPRISLRGTKFSLPLPQGGRNAITMNPVLREDQLPHKFLHPKTKKKANKQGDVFFPSDDIFRHQTDKRAPLQPPVRKALAVFSGKRNPNDNHFSRSKH